MRKGRKTILKVPIAWDRLEQALKKNGTSLRKLNNNPDFGFSEKTIRRGKKEGLNPIVLDKLCQCLNVNEDFLSGKYDRDIELDWEQYPDKIAEEKARIKVEDCPYTYSNKKRVPNGQYIKDLFIENNIPLEQMNDIPMEELVRFHIEIDRATYKILRKYFKPNPTPPRSFPMPPESEIFTD